MRRLLSCCLMLAWAACSNPTSSCDSSGIAGRWTYAATQNTPVRATISGSLTLETQNCVDVQGVLDAIEVRSTGESRHIAGAIAGTLGEGGLFRFGADVGGGSREHLARMAGDSLSGDWIETAMTLQGSGSFSSRRQNTP